MFHGLGKVIACCEDRYLKECVYNESEAFWLKSAGHAGVDEESALFVGYARVYELVLSCYLIFPCFTGRFRTVPEYAPRQKRGGIVARRV